jgi:hypothetical protein
MSAKPAAVHRSMSESMSQRERVRKTAEIGRAVADLVVAEGFQWHDDGFRVSCVSPYKRILEKGWLRNIWTNLTEKKIHEEWTVPRFHGYAGHLQARFVISPWNEETRRVEVSVAPLG